MRGSRAGRSPTSSSCRRITHAVYPEYLPDDVVTVAERPVLQLIEYLREQGSKAEIIYPLDELVAHKQHDLVYIKTDSHWNELGAFVAYKRLMRDMSQRSATVRDIEWDQLRSAGPSRPATSAASCSPSAPPRRSTST